MDLAAALECAEAALEFMDRRPAEVAYLLEHVARHPRCAEELATKSQAQTRCAQKWYKIAIHTLKSAGDEAAADAMWHRAVSLRTASGGPSAWIAWPSTLETPTIWLAGLQSKPVWDCGQWPFMQELEAASPQILAEVRRAAPELTKAYPYLSHHGSWQDMFLLRGHRWNAPLCEAMPLTCRLLLPELPTRLGVPFATTYHEEVVVFRSEPGTSVSPHCGSSNMVVNLHLTLVGGRGTTVRVGGKELRLRDRRAICFQDSFFHAIDHPSDGEAERISLVIRVMHPELSLATYGGVARTDVAELTGWDASADTELEVQRLRQEYRRLAAEMRGAPGAGVQGAGGDALPPAAPLNCSAAADGDASLATAEAGDGGASFATAEAATA